MAVNRSCILGVLFLIASPPAVFAQSDVVGNWAPLYHEDHPERIPEYRKRMGKPTNPPPARCERYCNCGLDGGGCALQ
jgi:hypothetical protein